MSVTVNKKEYQTLLSLSEDQLVAVPTLNRVVLPFKPLPVRFRGPLVPEVGSLLICDDLQWVSHLVGKLDGLLVFGGSVLGRPWHSHVPTVLSSVEQGDLIRYTYTIKCLAG